MNDTDRHRARADDHHPRLHQRPEDPRPDPSGHAPRPRRRHVDDPDHDRRRPRGRRGAAGTEGQARRLGGARADAQRQPGRPDLHARRATRSKEEVNAALKAASESGPLAGILDYTDEPLVSIDLNHNPASSTVDSLETAVIEGKLVRVVSWYDNEWGFSNRMVDTARAMAKLG